MPRGGWHGRKEGSTFGRPSKGGRQVNARLGAEAVAALEALQERWGLSQTAVVERALIEAAQALNTPPDRVE